jgi:hypothetical protein
VTKLVQELAKLQRKVVIVIDVITNATFLDDTSTNSKMIIKQLNNEITPFPLLNNQLFTACGSLMSSVALMMPQEIQNVLNKSRAKLDNDSDSNLKQ